MRACLKRQNRGWFLLRTLLHSQRARVGFPAPNVVVWAESECTGKGIYSSKDNTSSFPWRKGSKGVSQPPGCWLVTLGNGAVSRCQCWSVLADLALSSLVACKSMLLSLCIAPSSATMAALLIAPFGNGTNGFEEGLAVHRTGHLTYSISELLG